MRPMLSVAVAVTLAGCGYSSQYRPPVDGRARPLWTGDHVENNLAQLPIARACAEAIFATAHADPPRSSAVAVQFWIPPAASRSATRIADVSSDGDDELAYADPFLLRALIAMLMVLPIVDIVIGAEHPETEHFSAEAIDDVNAYNDLARRMGTPCSQATP